MGDVSDKNQDRSWHIKREITVGHLLTTGAIVVSAISWGLTIETRVAKNEFRIGEYRAGHDMALQRIENRLQRIEDKLDKKQDKDR